MRNKHTMYTYTPDKQKDSRKTTVFLLLTLSIVFAYLIIVSHFLA
jgi:hypothetical protein